MSRVREGAALQRSKYVGREEVLDARISERGPLFNDTVHCGPLHPHRLFVARKEAGFNPSTPGTDSGTHFGGGLFFGIPVERILTHPAFWYRWETPWINGYPDGNVRLTPPPDEFEPFEADRYRELEDVPSRHRSYLRRMSEEGTRPLMFVHIPHVLVAGPIDTRGLRVIQWEQPPIEG